jgi:hypothetical protein
MHRPAKEWIFDEIDDIEHALQQGMVLGPDGEVYSFEDATKSIWIECVHDAICFPSPGADQRVDQCIKWLGGYGTSAMELLLEHMQRQVLEERSVYGGSLGKVSLRSTQNRLDKEQLTLYSSHLSTLLARMMRTECPRNPEAPMGMVVTFSDLVNLTDVSEADMW